jgi:hypothetical protein
MLNTIMGMYMCKKKWIRSQRKQVTLVRLKDWIQSVRLDSARLVNIQIVYHNIHTYTLSVCSHSLESGLKKLLNKTTPAGMWAPVGMQAPTDAHRRPQGLCFHLGFNTGIFVQAPASPWAPTGLQALLCKKQKGTFNLQFMNAWEYPLSCKHCWKIAVNNASRWFTPVPSTRYYHIYLWVISPIYLYPPVHFF